MLTTGWVMKRWREGGIPLIGVIGNYGESNVDWVLEDADGEVEGARRLGLGLGESELIVGL